MTSSTKIRPLARLLDTSCCPVWVIGVDGRLAYASAAMGQWLGIDPESLIGRRAISGAPESDELPDRIAAALAPPADIDSRGAAGLRLTLPTDVPAAADARGDWAQANFVRLGGLHDRAVIGVCSPSGQGIDPHAASAAFQSLTTESTALRQQLDDWRSRHVGLAAIVSAGSSAAARRLRIRMNVAASLRTHVGLFGSEGCGADSIATRIHQTSAPNELLVAVEGPLMDAELLDATLSSVVAVLSESPESTATALVHGLDDTPIEAQERLVELLTTFAGRLRLIAICGAAPKLLTEPIEQSLVDEPDVDQTTLVGLHPRIVDFLSSLSITIPRLISRTADLPLLAAAVIDARHAQGEGAGNRLSRPALDALVTYPWPGDFVEFNQSLRHAVRTSPQSVIGIEHLPLVVRTYRESGNVTATNVTISLDDTLRRYEMQLIDEAVEAAGGNRAEAARRLGISRARLLRRIDEAGQRANEQ